MNGGNFYHKFRGSEGFTALELLIAIQLALLVISLAYISYLFSVGLLKRWNTNILTEEHLSVISSILSKSVDELEIIEFANTNELVGRKPNGDSLHIRLSDFVFINGKLLGDSTLHITSSKMEYILRPSDGASVPRLVTKVSPDALAHLYAIKFDVRFSIGSREYQIEVMARPLKRRPDIIQ
ncbi:MAG: hypothetical protein D6732_21760 [Methanobacteriota archaeon]|nr:MAG: hypothetical protein D6732_21760 [Euryarchaeota archaeon]